MIYLEEKLALKSDLQIPLDAEQVGRLVKYRIELIKLEGSVFLGYELSTSNRIKIRAQIEEVGNYLANLITKK